MIKIMLKRSPIFVIFTVFSYILSKLLILGAGIISNAVDTMSLGSDLDVGALLTATAFLIACAFIAAYLKTISGEFYSIKVQEDCRNLAVKALEDAEYSKLAESSGIVINRLTSDMNDLNTLLSEIIPDIITYFITITTVGISIFRIEWRIFAGMTIVFPIIIPISNIIAKKINSLAKKRRGRYDELAEIASDNLAGVEVCRTYQLEGFLENRINLKSEEILQNEYTRNAYQASANFITCTLRWIPSIVCSLIALRLVLSHIITSGQLMAFMILFGKITSPLSELPFRVIDARETLVSVNRIDSIIDLAQEKCGSYTDDTAKQKSHAIHCAGIAFQYTDEKAVLKNVDFNADIGEKIAIVGSSGSGKTTLLKILCGFEQPASGTYELFGHDFSDWNLRAARKLISLVPQDVFLFSGTIEDNVAYGSGEAPAVRMKKVIIACKKAGIHEKICSLPDGYQTVLGERGATLSGGEKQRLAIARALYKDAPITIMDEPTSALDEETERIISSTLAEKSAARAIIIIAHRLSTIKNADRIYVVDNGVIAESGRHEELLAKQGVYAALYHNAYENGGNHEHI